MKIKTILKQSLFRVEVLRNEEGKYGAQFIIPGGTINEFIFGEDEEEAKAKTAQLILSYNQGLEFVQSEIQNSYSRSLGTQTS